MVQSNNGGKLTGEGSVEIYNHHRVRHEHTTLASPEFNGVAEGELDIVQQSPLSYLDLASAWLRFANYSIHSFVVNQERRRIIHKRVNEYMMCFTNK